MYLNYPRRGPAVGAYLGPNDLGEYLTVVSNEEYTEPDGLMITSRRVGLRHGIYTVKGELTGVLPPEVWEAIAREQIAAKQRQEAIEAEAWKATRTIRTRGPLHGLQLPELPGDR